MLWALLLRKKLKWKLCADLNTSRFSSKYSQYGMQASSHGSLMKSYIVRPGSKELVEAAKLNKGTNLHK